MFGRYLLTFVPVLAAVSLGLCALPFVTRSQVPAGRVVQEVWTHEFTLDTGLQETYRVEGPVKETLEQGIAFVGSGVVRVRSAAVELTTKDVSWESNKTKYTAPGARMVSRITWEAAAEARSGETGEVELKFPEIPGASYRLGMHSGPYQKTGGGRIVLREVTAHHGGLEVAVARFNFALGAGLPVAILLHGAWWGFQLAREKKRRLADLAAAASAGQVRMFYSSPVAEWAGWTTTVCIFGLVGSLLAAFVIYDGYQSSMLGRVMLVIQAVGVVIGLMVAWIAGRMAVTVRLDDGGIAYAKGRSEPPQWAEARWGELRGAELKSKTVKGTTTTWLEVRFADGKKRKIPQGVSEFDELKRVVLEKAGVAAN